jgi:cardiolipin synthase
MTIGSYNVNNLSAYASIELNLDIRNAQLAKQMHSTLDDIISKDCMAIGDEYFSKHNTLLHQLVRWISYQTLSLIFYLVTFYYRQRD